MNNPWLKKNPYLSMWLSGANAIAGAARGHANRSAKQQATASMHQMTEAVMNAWLAPMTPPSPRRRKRR